MQTCLICDDHVLVREALAGTIRLRWPEAAIAEVGDFPAAWARAAKGVDLCIADLMMPGATPLRGIEGLRRAAPDMPILVVTATVDDAVLLELLDMGIHGFAQKTSSGAIIEAALQLIMAGGRYLPPRLAEIAATRIDTGSVALRRDGAVLAVDRLTERQMEVLRLMAQGLSNKDIARMLALAPSTVKTHVANIQSCLGAANRTDAAIKARGLNLV